MDTSQQFQEQPFLASWINQSISKNEPGGVFSLGSNFQQPNRLAQLFPQQSSNAPRWKPQFQYHPNNISNPYGNRNLGRIRASSHVSAGFKHERSDTFYGGHSSDDYQRLNASQRFQDQMNSTSDYVTALLPVEDLLNSKVQQTSRNEAPIMSGHNELQKDSTNLLAKHTQEVQRHLQTHQFMVNNQSFIGNTNNLSGDDFYIQTLTSGREHHIVNNALSKSHQKYMANSTTPKHMQSPTSNTLFPDPKGKGETRLTIQTRQSATAACSASQYPAWKKSEFNRNWGDESTAWLPVQSVKTPYEPKPGMKMSTYGGDKRRSKINRYLDFNNSLRISLNESMHASNANTIDGDSSIHTSTGRRHYTQKKRQYLKLANADKASIARQLDSIQLDHNKAFSSTKLRSKSNKRQRDMFSHVTEGGHTSKSRATTTAGQGPQDSTRLNEESLVQTQDSLRRHPDEFSARQSLVKVLSRKQSKTAKTTRRIHHQGRRNRLLSQVDHQQQTEHQTISIWGSQRDATARHSAEKKPAAPTVLPAVQRHPQPPAQSLPIRPMRTIEPSMAQTMPTKAPPSTFESRYSRKSGITINAQGKILGEAPESKADRQTTLLVQKSLTNTRMEIKQALKSTCLVLTDLMDDPKKKNHYQLRPAAPVHIKMKPFVKEYVQIDIQFKLMPAIIKLSGVRDDVSVFLSTSAKYPDEGACQAVYHNLRRIEFSMSAGIEERNAKFTKQYLYLAVESACETLMRLSVIFGSEERQKQQVANSSADANAQAAQFGIQTQSFFAKVGSLTHETILHTASRNPIEHQKRLRLKIESLVNNKKQAEEFLNWYKSNQRDRSSQEREEYSARDFITDNKQDAGVWKHLKAFTRQEAIQSERVKQVQAQERKEYIDQQQHEEAENYLKRREVMKIIREYVLQTISEQKENMIRLRTFTSHIVLRYLFVHLWNLFVHRREEYMQSMRMLCAGIKLKIFLRKYQVSRGTNFYFRIKNEQRRRLAWFAITQKEAQEERAKHYVKAILVDGVTPFQLKTAFHDFQQKLKYIQRRIHYYLKVKQTKAEMVQLWIDREKSRMEELEDQGDLALKKLLYFAQITSPEYQSMVINKYLAKCKQAYIYKFVAWRAEIKALERKGMCDDRYNWRQPMISARVVWDLSEIAMDTGLPVNMTNCLDNQVAFIHKSYPTPLKPNLRNRHEDKQLLQKQQEDQRSSAKQELSMMGRQRLLKKMLIYEDYLKEKTAAPQGSEDVKETEEAMAMVNDEIIRDQKLKNKGVFYTNKPTRFPDKPSLQFYPTTKVILVLIAQAAAQQFPDFQQQMAEAIKASKKQKA